MAVPNTLARWEKFRQRERLTCEVVSPRDLMRMSEEAREDYNDLRLRVIAQDRVLGVEDVGQRRAPRRPYQGPGVR